MCIADMTALWVGPWRRSYLQDLAEQSLQQETGKWAEVHDFGWLRATQSPNW